jgi:glycosyltransferase involved in cell wall biosynthesis
MDSMDAAEGNYHPVTHRALDRAKWHRPLCSVILTHRNYSSLVEESLLSLLDQTYENWECVIVDDFSSEDERGRLHAIIEASPDSRVRFIQNTEQLGQIGAFFAGFAETTGEFVSPLDPDDRLDSTYLEEMVAAHLNEAVFCPIVSCEQRLLSLDGDALVTGTWKGRLRTKNRLQAEKRRGLGIDVTSPDEGPLLYFSPRERNWLWTSSSAIMVRRSALNLLAPNKRLELRGPALDAYLANGAHFLGGTLFLSKPLVYRGIHSKTWYLTDRIFSMQQNLGKSGWTTQAPQCKRALVEAMFQNGVTRWFSETYLAQVLRTHFDSDQMTLIRETCPEAYRLWLPSESPARTRSFLGRAKQRISRLFSRA